MKKILTTLAISAMAFTVSATASIAAWNTCTPSSVGPAGTVIRVYFPDCTDKFSTSVTDGAGWVTLKSDMQDQQLAVVLTAMSMGQTMTLQTGVTTDSAGYDVANSLLFDAE